MPFVLFLLSIFLFLPYVGATPLVCGSVGARTSNDVDQAIRIANVHHGAMARLVAYKKSVAELAMNYARASRCAQPEQANRLRSQLAGVESIWANLQSWVQDRDAYDLKHMHSPWWRQLQCNHDLPLALENKFNQGINELRLMQAKVQSLMTQLTDTDEVSYAHERAQLLLVNEDLLKTQNYIQLRVNEHLNRVRFAAELLYFKFIRGGWGRNQNPCRW